MGRRRSFSDPANGSSRGRGSGGPGGVERVWAISRTTKTLYRISNAGSPTPSGTVVFASPPASLAVSDGSVWVATEDGSLVQIVSS
jgi:hypothetical protein